jgi:hypothetical protein
MPLPLPLARLAHGIWKMEGMISTQDRKERNKKLIIFFHMSNNRNIFGNSLLTCMIFLLRLKSVEQLKQSFSGRKDITHRYTNYVL